MATGAHITDFIEKQSSARCQFKFSHACLVGVGERATLVSKQLAFQKGLHQGSAVDGDERSTAAIALIVQVACQDLLAGSVHSENQNAQIRLGHFVRTLANVQNVGMLTNELDFRSCIVDQSITGFR